MDHQNFDTGTNFRALCELPEVRIHRIEVRILLQRTLSRQSMSKLAWNLSQDNMQLDVVAGHQRRIIVSGTVPDNQYKAHSVLAVVKEFDDGASIIP